MNLLQHLETSQNIFVTLNPYKLPKKTTIFRKINYSHPIFDKNAVYAQKFISNKNNTIFCADNFLYAKVITSSSSCI